MAAVLPGTKRSFVIPASDFPRNLKSRNLSGAPMKLQTSILFLLATLSCGCSSDLSSRWAMDDSEYASRYSRPYPGNDLKKLGRKLKQSSDARHVADSAALYVGAGASDAPFTVGGDIGLLRYSSDSIEQRFGLRGLAGTGEKDLLTGFDTGLRFHLPTRLTPFVGVGVFAGGSTSKTPAEDDNIDNDRDHSTDEDGETAKHSKLYAAVYPEVGVSWWLSSRSRATLSVQHHFSTSGRDEDYTFFGLTLASRVRFRDPDVPARQPVPETDSSEADSQQISATTTEAAEWTDQSEVETPLDWLEASEVSDAE
jgi:hypothetical protein